MAAPADPYPFISSVLGARMPVVAEIKRRAADGTDLLRQRSAREMAERYAAMGAPAISVVTGSWFGGTAELLEETAAATRLPVLVKDFFFTPSHIDRAAGRGAAAVLLTAEILPRTVLPVLIEHCLDRGLTPFVEVTDAEQTARVVHPEDCVIAVNNKDIRDRERGTADLGRSRRLLPAVLETGTPLPMSASGIDTPSQARCLLDSGFRGLLVGTALLRAEHLTDWSPTVV